MQPGCFGGCPEHGAAIRKNNGHTSGLVDQQFGTARQIPAGTGSLKENNDGGGGPIGFRVNTPGNRRVEGESGVGRGDGP